jgi:hypothetical protein
MIQKKFLYFKEPKLEILTQEFFVNTFFYYYISTISYLEINGTVEVLQKLFRSIQFDILQHFEQIKNQNLKDKLSKVKNTTGLIGPILAVQNSFFRNSFKVFSPSVPYAISISSEAVPPQKNIVKSSPINIPASLQFTKKKFQG